MAHLKLVPPLPDDGSERQTPGRPQVRPSMRLPNGMRMPRRYGVYKGRWFPSNAMGSGTYLLFSYSPDSPGPEWFPSRDLDEIGRPWAWKLEVPGDRLERRVSVGVGASWRGFKLSLINYRDGVVSAWVGVPEELEEKVDRGEIPEIRREDRFMFGGDFRWEELEEFRQTERDLL